MAITTAEKSVPEERPVKRSRSGDLFWISQVTLLAIVMGALVGLAVRSQSQLQSQGIASTRFVASAALAYNLSERNKELRRENQRLLGRLADAEARLATGSTGAAQLHQSLREARFLAGLTPVKGRGIIVTLRDSPKRAPADMDPSQLNVHAEDLIAFLNELKAAGAEAIAVAGADMSDPQRVTAMTAVRCVGPTVHVNNVPLAGPYYIFAIGNPKTLRGALEMPGGIIKNQGLDTLGMVQIESRDEMILPAYSGQLVPREAHPVDDQAP